MKTTPGKSIRFAMLDSGGVKRSARGVVIEAKQHVIIVRLTTNWWGSYLRGCEVRVYPDEIIP
jgi:hypothetical protein